jgi:hypothetical protein
MTIEKRLGDLSLSLDEKEVDGFPFELKLFDMNNQNILFMKLTVCQFEDLLSLADMVLAEKIINFLKESKEKKGGE